MIELLRFFVGDAAAIQMGTRPGLFTVAGTADECTTANAALEAVRARVGMTPSFGAWLCLDSGEVALPAVWDGSAARFRASANRPALPDHARLHEIVTSGLMTRAPGRRTMLWHGFRATSLPAAGEATSVWAHGSGLLQLGERWVVSWDGPLQGTLAVRADLRPDPRDARAEVNAGDCVRSLPLGPLLRPGTSPRSLQLGGRAERDEEPPLSLERLRECLGPKEPARTALSRANLRLFQDVLLAGGTGADLAAIGKAIEAACELPQLSFEVRFGELSDEALAALERGGTLDPAGAAKQGSIELPSLLGQPFGSRS
jgi:hypothetical protein